MVMLGQLASATITHKLKTGEVMDNKYLHLVDTSLNEYSSDQKKGLL
jgi:hypothetical protein